MAWQLSVIEKNEDGGNVEGFFSEGIFSRYVEGPVEATRIVQTRNLDLDWEVELTNDLADNLNNMRAAGAIIDDNNIPVEENIPDPTVTIHNNDNVFEAEWGFKGICYRKRDGNIDYSASIPVQNALWEQYDCVDWFFFFSNWLCKVTDTPRYEWKAG